MTDTVHEMYDVVIVGGGIAGGAMAAVVARAGKAVLMLERESVYRDRVRGEYIQPWGVAEATRLGLYSALAGAGGTHHARLVPYDETVEPAEAEASAVQLDQLLPGVPGTLGLGHPAACEALAAAAAEAGAHVRRGVEAVKLERGPLPGVRYRWGSVDRTARCRLVVGADGRDSAVRRQLGISLHSTPARLLGAGLLVRNLWGWPEHQVSIGTQDDRVFFVLPQGHGRARLYLMYAADQRRRFAGAGGGRTFLDSFDLACVPGSQAIVRAEPAGPCAAYPMTDTWTDSPLADGVVLIGDAAGHSDPHLGQGLSLALRDVRGLSELLLGTNDWSPAALGPYAEARTERMRRLRICAEMLTTLRGEFGPGARERRRRARARMQADAELGSWRKATTFGPDSTPAEAFEPEIRKRLFAPAAMNDCWSGLSGERIGEASGCVDR